MIPFFVGNRSRLSDVFLILSFCSLSFFGGGCLDWIPSPTIMEVEGGFDAVPLGTPFVHLHLLDCGYAFRGATPTQMLFTTPAWSFFASGPAKEAALACIAIV